MDGAATSDAPASTESGSDAQAMDAGDASSGSDGATSDGATTDGGTTDGGTTDGASTDGATTDGASSDGASSDGSGPDGGDGGLAAHAGQATVSGGFNAKSPSYSLVSTTGQAPGGNTTMSSPSYRMTAGLVGGTQGN